MKHIKKATALLLASCMTVGMALPVYAAEPSVQKVLDGDKLATFSSSEGRAVSEDELTTSDSEWDVIYLVNKVRMQNGLEPLSVNAQMQQAADVRKEELVTQFDHTRPNGTDCFTALNEAGVSYTTAGENIAAGQVDAMDAMDSWMNSDGHRANILTEEFTHIGAGHYETNQGYGNYWVQLFTGSCTPTNIEIDADVSEGSWILPDEYTIDNIGLELKVECEHGTSYMPIIEEMCSPVDMTKKDEPQDVTVSYGGQTATFSVVVKDTMHFDDVDEDAWYYDYVATVYYNDIMKGLTDTKFGTNSVLSRSQFATILYRLVGEPEVEFEDYFDDVAPGQWYSDAIIWAVEEGVVTGYADGRFGINDSLTREQLVVMLYRFEGEPDANYDYSSFKDAGKVSSYATDAISWAVEKGLLTGKDGGTRLDPQGKTTRAEAAAIIVRFLNSIEE